MGPAGFANYESGLLDMVGMAVEDHTSVDEIAEIEEPASAADLGLQHYEKTGTCVGKPVSGLLGMIGFAVEDMDALHKAEEDASVDEIAEIGSLASVVDHGLELHLNTGRSVDNHSHCKSVHAPQLHDAGFESHISCI